MTKDEMIKLLFSDVAAWNKWRLANPDIRADLTGADLRGADLRGADLTGAHLTRAHLSGADLRGAHLARADLRGAVGVNPFACTPLLLLQFQPGPIRLFKLTNSAGEGPFNGGLTYEVGGFYEILEANTNVNQDCGAGINVATLDWCIREWKPGYRIFMAEFTAADLAAVPTATDGKIRLRSCKIVEELDLVAIGLVNAEEAEAGK